MRCKEQNLYKMRMDPEKVLLAKQQNLYKMLSLNMTGCRRHHMLHARHGSSPRSPHHQAQPLPQSQLRLEGSVQLAHGMLPVGGRGGRQE